MQKELANKARGRVDVARGWFSALARWQQIALVVVVLLLLRALFAGSEPPSSPPPSQVRIEVSERKAEPHQRAIVMYGSSWPARDVNLNAQASGQVMDVIAKEGAFLQKGEPILSIDARERPERLAQAEAILKQREIEYEAARKLQKRGFESEVRLAQSKAQLEEARASLKQIRLETKFLTLSAPFDGLLEAVNVEEGDFVGIGTFGVEGATARMVDVNPLIIKARLAETDRAEVVVGDAARVRLADGSEHDAVVSMLGNVADAQSRTFAIEAEVRNPDLSLPAGVSAELTVFGAARSAYRVSGSVLGLNDAGEVGIKRLDEENRVLFEPAEILEEAADGLWIAIEPQQMRLITAGHAYVSAGQLLAPEVVEVKQ